MAKYIQIHIDTPCHQKWEDMHPAAAGNFCNSCKKNVIDFTGMSDNQLMEYFKNNRSSVCGRFYEDQLNMPLPIPVKKIPWLRYFFQISLPALLLGYKANAQRVLKKNPAPIELREIKNDQPNALGKDFTVTGTITGKNGDPVSYASVMIKGSEVGVSADSSGAFKITLPQDIRFLEITAVGYEKKLVPVNNTRSNIELNIPLSTNISLEAVTVVTNRRMTLGGIMVSSYSIRNTINKIPVPSTSSLVIFPNPARRNSELTIRFNEPVINDQEIVLYNSAGKRLMQKTINVKGRQMEVKLKLDVTSAGYYVLHITDQKTHVTQLSKLVVQ
jgi:hypothetical protein